MITVWESHTSLTIASALAMVVLIMYAVTASLWDIEMAIRRKQ